MIEKPPSPHGLIGDHWPEIDEVGIANVASALVKAGTSAGTAEQKSYQDGGAYQALLPEGFETQVEAAFKVGGMAADLSGWFAKCGTETGVVAEGVATAKLTIALTTTVAEAVIASKEAEIAALQAMSLRPELRAQRIQQLRAEIKQITDDAKQAIQELYDGIYTPTAPASPGLQPLIHNDQPFPNFDDGGTAPAGSGSETGKGDVSALDNSIPGTKGDVGQGATDSKGDVRSAGDGNVGKGDIGKPTELSNPKGDVRPVGVVENAQPGVTAPSPSASAPTSPSTSTSSGAASSLSSMGSAMPKMGGGMPSAPSGSGLGGGSGLSGLGSGGGASASPASLNPTQQFLSGVGQGFSQSPLAASGASAAAAAQPFKPPAGSTMQTSAAPSAPAASGSIGIGRASAGGRVAGCAGCRYAADDRGCGWCAVGATAGSGCPEHCAAAITDCSCGSSARWRWWWVGVGSAAGDHEPWCQERGPQGCANGCKRGRGRPAVDTGVWCGDGVGVCAQ
jgi:hypothetical protein